MVCAVADHAGLERVGLVDEDLVAAVQEHFLDRRVLLDPAVDQDRDAQPAGVEVGVAGHDDRRVACLAGKPELPARRLERAHLPGAAYRSVVLDRAQAGARLGAGNPGVDGLLGVRCRGQPASVREPLVGPLAERAGAARAGGSGLCRLLGRVRGHQGHHLGLDAERAHARLDRVRGAQDGSVARHQQRRHHAVVRCPAGQQLSHDILPDAGGRVEHPRRVLRAVSTRDRAVSPGAALDAGEDPMHGRRTGAARRTRRPRAPQEAARSATGTSIVSAWAAGPRSIGASGSVFGTTLQ